MPTHLWTLSDQEQNAYVDQISVTPEVVGGKAAGYCVTKHTLAAGLSQGVDVIEVCHGDFHFTVVPTRGMGIWKAALGDLPLGWKSPVRGPVHPAFVRTEHPDGIGWLDGFDELLVRCGLESNGAPEFQPDGRLRYGLHGKIANIPAHKVEVAIDGDAGRIAIHGTVDEARLFGRKLRLETSIETKVGRPAIVVRDTITNLSAAAGDCELLYHVNFGPPLVQPGSKVVLPVRRLAPRDAMAATDLSTWDVYGPETPGANEVCFFVQPWGDGEDNTRVLLHNRAATQGVVLKFNLWQLPCFTIWKNREAAADGYVTGLEPATNFPNMKSFEKRRGRVVSLAPGESRLFELEMTALADAAEVRAAAAAVHQLQKGTRAEIVSKPDPYLSAGGEG
jgi:hypothetical protein